MVNLRAVTAQTSFCLRGRGPFRREASFAFYAFYLPVNPVIVRSLAGAVSFNRLGLMPFLKKSHAGFFLTVYFFCCIMLLLGVGAVAYLM